MSDKNGSMRPVSHIPNCIIRIVFVWNISRVTSLLSSTLKFSRREWSPWC